MINSTASAGFDNEKGEDLTYDHPGATDTSDDGELVVECPPHTTERKMMTRIDWHILPFVTILYLLAFLDRVNIANARTFNLEADLGLKKTEYNTGRESLL